VFVHSTFPHPAIIETLDWAPNWKKTKSDWQLSTTNENSRHRPIISSMINLNGCNKYLQKHIISTLAAISSPNGMYMILSIFYGKLLLLVIVIYDHYCHCWCGETKSEKKTHNLHVEFTVAKGCSNIRWWDRNQGWNYLFADFISLIIWCAKHPKTKVLGQFEQKHIWRLIWYHHSDFNIACPTCFGEIAQDYSWMVVLLL